MRCPGLRESAGYESAGYGVCTVLQEYIFVTKTDLTCLTLTLLETRSRVFYLCQREARPRVLSLWQREARRRAVTLAVLTLRSCFESAMTGCLRKHSKLTSSHGSHFIYRMDCLLLKSTGNLIKNNSLIVSTLLNRRCLLQQAPFYGQE